MSEKDGEEQNILKDGFYQNGPLMIEWNYIVHYTDLSALHTEGTTTY